MEVLQPLSRFGSTGIVECGSLGVTSGGNKQRQSVAIPCRNLWQGPQSHLPQWCDRSPSVKKLRKELYPAAFETLSQGIGFCGSGDWRIWTSSSVRWRRRREGACVVVVRAANRVFKRTGPNSRPSIASILHNLNSSGSNVVQVLDKQARFLNASDWFAIMEGLGRQQKWLLALEVFRWMQKQKWYKPDSGFCSKLISIMGRAKQLRLAIWLFGEMKRNGHRPDTSLYNALISAHIQSRDKGRGFEKALQILEEMKTKPKCRPNVVTYNILLRASAQLGDILQVKSLFEEMEAAKIPPDVFSYNGVIDAYGKTGDYVQMENTLLSMRGEHCKPDLVTYNTLIDAYGRGGAFSKMEQVLKSMMGAKSRHKPDVKTYNAIMCSYARAGEVEKMEWSLSRMEAANFKPNLITYEVLITGYGHVGDFNKMRENLDQMLEVGIQPQLSTLSAMIGAYCEHNLFEEAEGLLSKARKWHIRPQASTYSIILRAYGKASRIEDMERLLERMKGAGILPNRATFMEFLGFYGLSSWSEKLTDSDFVVQGGQDEDEDDALNSQSDEGG